MRKSFIIAFFLILFSFIGCNLIDFGYDSSVPVESAGFDTLKNLKSIHGFGNYDSIGLAHKKSTGINTRDAEGEKPFLIGLSQDGSVESIYMIDKDGNKVAVDGVKTFTRLTDEYSLLVLADDAVNKIDSYNTSIYKTGLNNEVDYIVNTKTGKLYKLEESYKKIAKDLLEANGFNYSEKYITDERYYDYFDGLFRNQMIPSDNSVYLFSFLNLNNKYKAVDSKAEGYNNQTPSCDEGSECEKEESSTDCEDCFECEDCFNLEGDVSDCDSDSGCEDSSESGNVGSEESDGLEEEPYFKKVIKEVADKNREYYSSHYPKYFFNENECLYTVAKGYSELSKDEELKQYVLELFDGCFEEIDPDDEYEIKPRLNNGETLFSEEFYYSGMKAFLEDNLEMLEETRVKDLVKYCKKYFYGWKYYGLVAPEYDIEYSKYLFVYKLVFDGDDVSLELYDKVDCYDYVVTSDSDNYSYNRSYMLSTYFYQVLFCNKTILNQLYWDADGDTNCGFVYDIPTKSFVENDYDNVKLTYNGEIYDCGTAFDDRTNRCSSEGIEFVPFAVGDGCRYYAVNRGLRADLSIEYGNNLARVPAGFVKLDSNNNVNNVIRLSNRFRDNAVIASSVIYSLGDDDIKILYLSNSDEFVTVSLEDELVSVLEGADMSNVDKSLENRDGRCILTVTTSDLDCFEFEVTSNGKIVKYEDSDIEILDLQPVDCK